jgi:hypothetical protein
MTTRSQKAKAGLFVIAAGVLLAIVLFVFGGLHLWGGRERYVVGEPAARALADEAPRST